MNRCRLSEIERDYGWQLYQYYPGVYRLRPPFKCGLFAQIYRKSAKLWIAEIRARGTGDLTRAAGIHYRLRDAVNESQVILGGYAHEDAP